MVVYKWGIIGMTCKPHDEKNTMIGQRLKLARAAAGLSLRELQKRIGNRVTAQAIGKYERNESIPSSGVLLALTEALGVPVDYLVGEEELSLEGVEFRKRRVTGKKEKARIEATVLGLIERYLTIEELLGLRSAEWDQPPEAPYPVRDLGEAEAAAEKVRDYWDLGKDPVANLVELFEERGIKVLRIDCGSQKIDGLTARVFRKDKKEAVPVIVVCKGAPGERQRVNLARELGHMVMAVAGDESFHEKAAHRFAGAFLMPAEALWAEVGKHRTSISWGELLALKRLFRVSVKAIVYRCRDLGIVSRAWAQGFYREYASLEYSGERGEPEPLPPEDPQRFVRLCYRALAEGAVSESKAAELLGMTVRELRRRLEEREAAVLTAG